MRSRALAAAARTDLAQGQLASAETNFRLALHYAPSDRRLQEELKEVAELREAVRREAKLPGR
jgi:Flp pilus assembly protein TadD